MEYFKPYSYLFKRTSGTLSLKSCSVVLIPAGKKITLRSGDPDTDGNLTLIRYAVENDNSQFNARQEDLIHQFAWDGNSHSVQVVIGVGSGDEGGKTEFDSGDAEEI